MDPPAGSGEDGQPDRPAVRAHREARVSLRGKPCRGRLPDGRPCPGPYVDDGPRPARLALKAAISNCCTWDSTCAQSPSRATSSALRSKGPTVARRRKADESVDRKKATAWLSSVSAMAR